MELVVKVLGFGDTVCLCYTKALLQCTAQCYIGVTENYRNMLSLVKKKVRFLVKFWYNCPVLKVD